MSTTRLPPAPVPDDHRYAVNDWKGRVVYMDHVPAGQQAQETQSMFCDETLHAYGLAVWKAAMQTAAKECERYEGEQWQKYKRGHGTERDSDYCQGQSDGGGDCANAIRSLPLPEQGSPQ